MTISAAFRAAMAPYVLPKDSVELLLIGQGLSGSADYNKSEHETALYSAVVEGLEQVKTLTRESDPGSSNSYDTSKIDDMIRHYRRKYNLDTPDEEDYEFIDRTDEF